MIYRLTRQADRNIGEIYLHAAEQFGIRQADQYVHLKRNDCPTAS